MSEKSDNEKTQKNIKNTAIKDKKSSDKTQNKKIHKHRSSKENPFNLIQKQHSAHKTRVVFIVAGIFLLLIGTFLSFLGYEHYQKYLAKQRKIDAVVSQLKNYQKKIQTLQSYTKYKTALEAYNLASDAARTDYEHPAKWKKYKKIFSDIIKKGKINKNENFINSSIFADMVYIPSGTFKMGARPDEVGKPDEFPQHQVDITKYFWISKYEITNQQFRILYPQFHVSDWDRYSLDAPKQPVAGISWHIAEEFCMILTSKARKAGKLPDGYEYRLPTEAEWEYAAKAGTETFYFWGDKFKPKATDYANSWDAISSKQRQEYKETAGKLVKDDGFRAAAPVGSYKPNAFGLYDMHGNIMEWCYDWYNPQAYSELSEKNPVQTEPVTADVEKRRKGHFKTYITRTVSKVMRGGHWGSHPEQCRSAKRFREEAGYKNIGVGLRIVLGPIITDTQ